MSTKAPAAKKRKAQATQATAGPSKRLGSQGKEGLAGIRPEDAQYINAKVKQYGDARTPTTVHADRLKDSVSQVMRHMLACNHKDPGKPVKREHLAALLKSLGHLGPKDKTFMGAVTSRAQFEFASRFGLDMVQMPYSTTQCFVLRTLLPRDFITKYVHTKPAAAMDALKFSCLTFLHLKGGKCTEDELWTYLAKFGFYRATDPAAGRAGAKEHPAFGMTPSAALEALVTQRVLLAKRDMETPEHTMMYRAGDAATGDVAELSEASMKAAIQQLTTIVPM